MTHSLGGRLRAQQDALAREGLAKQARENDEVLMKERSRQRQVRAFFEDVKDRTISAVERRKALKPVEMPSLFQDPDYQKLVTDPTHRDHVLFKEFEGWLTENDLTAKCWFEQDGAGMRGWLMFGVEPAPDAVSPFDKLLAAAEIQMRLGNAGDALAAVLAALSEAKKTGQAVIDEDGVIERIKSLLAKTGIHVF